jgi:hypothetical protein
LLKHGIKLLRVIACLFIRLSPVPPDCMSHPAPGYAQFFRCFVLGQTTF